MPPSTVIAADRLAAGSMAAVDFGPEAQASAVSWGAIFAGAAAAAALSLLMLILGTGLGLSSVSPWAHDGITARTFSVGAILWITFTQIVASALGGYLAGRLRTKWATAQADEISFRDTAHGFLAWAIASLATAALLTSVIGSIVSGGIRAGATVAGGAAVATGAATTSAVGSVAGDESTELGIDKSMGYFTDSLFRRNAGASAAGSQSTGATAAPGAVQESAIGSSSEVTRIFMNGISAGELPAEDARYIGQLVAQRTGLSQEEAEKRVNETFKRMQTKAREAETAAKEAADKARKASAYTSLWLFLSLLIGAFVASLTATFGGRERDA